MSKIENQIATLLHVANQQLAYCKFIAQYPRLNGKQNFDVASPSSIFYRNTCVAYFNDCLLSVWCLIQSDPRVISFSNWPEFMTVHNKDLEEINQLFVSKGFKDIRDQVVAHLDIANHINRSPDTTMRALIREESIDELGSIIEQLIALFLNYTKRIDRPYSDNYFTTETTLVQIREIMDKAKPMLTDDFYI